MVIAQVPLSNITISHNHFWSRRLLSLSLVVRSHHHYQSIYLIRDFALGIIFNFFFLFFSLLSKVSFFSPLDSRNVIRNFYQTRISKHTRVEKVSFRVQSPLKFSRNGYGLMIECLRLWWKRVWLLYWIVFGTHFGHHMDWFSSTIISNDISLHEWLACAIRILEMIKKKKAKT